MLTPMADALMQGRSKRVNGAVPTSPAAYVSIAAHVKNLKPLRKAMGFVANSNKGRIPPVALLLGCGGPTTVVWRIWTIVVDTVNRVFWPRPFAHVLREGQKAVTPAITNKNATSTIARIVWRGGICTAISHPVPDTIERMPGEALRMSGEALLSYPLKKVAPARDSGARTQVTGRHRKNGTAITTAPAQSSGPTLIGRMMAKLLNDNKPSESLVNKGDCLHLSLRNHCNTDAIETQPGEVLVAL